MSQLQQNTNDIYKSLNNLENQVDTFSYNPYQPTGKNFVALLSYVSLDYFPSKTILIHVMIKYLNIIKL